MKFYDTNALLLLLDKAFEEPFIISDETLKETERIKSSAQKTEDARYRARRLAHLLDENYERYTVSVYDRDVQDGDDKEPDLRIIKCAAYCDRINNDLVFVTNDINCKNLARLYGLRVDSVKDEDLSDPYKGFTEVQMSDTEMAFFYENMKENIYDLYRNEYLIIRDGEGNVVDAYCWDGKQHRPLYKKSVESIYFEKLKAKDIYQTCAIDSIMSNQLTAISGKAGSGKSLISLVSIMNLIKRGEYDRVVIMFNPTKTRGASDMGFYGGDAVKKAMQNSVGQVLMTKFGDRSSVDFLINDEKIKLVSMADCRGMEIRDREILYITEAQNTSVDLIKLCLSRVSSDAKVVIEGDFDTQVDSRIFEGINNGLRRVITKFKGEPEFGFVELQKVWRSRIAMLCEYL